MNNETACNKAILLISEATMGDIDNAIVDAIAKGSNKVHIQVDKRSVGESYTTITMYLKRLGFKDVEVRTVADYVNRAFERNIIEFSWY